MPRVTVWLPAGPDEEPAEPSILDLDVDYISFINNETHGIPALLSSRAGASVEAEDGQKILYVNTSLVPLLEVEK